MKKQYICSLAEIRDDHGTTLQELADAISISRQALSAIEKNISVPSVSTALDIANHFNIPVKLLFEEKN